MRNLMISEFRKIDLKALERAVAFQSISPSHITNPTGQGDATYLFTIGMDDVPPDEETITIEIDNLTIGDTVMNMALTMPLINLPQAS